MLSSREFRLAAVAVVGLGLIVLARTGDSAPDSVAAQSAEEAPDVAVVGQEGTGGSPATSGGDLASDEELATMAERAIRLVDFGEVDATPDLCAEGLGDEVRSSLGSIELSGGASEVLDTTSLSQLDVLNEAYGDISGDGVDEAVVHTVCDYGASGRQHEVQVWDASSGVAEPVGVVPEPAEELTGPFPSDITEMAIADGVLDVTWTAYAEDDPNCCPSDAVTLSYQLVDGEIVEAE